MNDLLMRLPTLIILIAVVIVGGIAVHSHDLTWGQYMLALGVGGGGLGIGYGLDERSRP